MLPDVTVFPGLSGVPADPAVTFDAFIRDFCDRIARDFTKLPHISALGVFDIGELQSVDIVISGETRPSRYKAIGVKGFLDRILREWPDIPAEAADEIKATLCGDALNREWIYRVADIISRYKNEPQEDVLKRVKDLLNAPPRLPYRSNMLGEYDAANKRIVLYHKAIRSYAAKSGIGMEEAYGRVYFHELFHAYHHLCGNGITRELSCRGDHTAEVVKESLAAYFELFCCAFPRDGTKAVWYVNSPAYWPYAGAKYVTDNRFFAEIFLTSLSDLDAALRKLLDGDGDVFYAVKNVK